MIVATVVLLVATFVLIPIPFRLFVQVDFENITARVVIRLGCIKVFDIKLFVDGANIAYGGTICGKLQVGDGKSRLKLGNIEWLSVKLQSFVCLSADGVRVMGVIGLVNGILYARLRQNSVKYVCDMAFADKFALDIDAKCQVSLIALVGV